MAPHILIEEPSTDWQGNYNVAGNLNGSPYNDVQFMVRFCDFLLSGLQPGITQLAFKETLTK